MNHLNIQEVVVWSEGRGEGNDDEGNEDDDPDRVGEGEKGGGDDTVIAAHGPPPVIQHQAGHPDLALTNLFLVMSLLSLKYVSLVMSCLRVSANHSS